MLHYTWRAPQTSLHVISGISSERPLGDGSEPPCNVSLAHWCPLYRKGASPATVRGNFVDSSTDRNLLPILIAGVLWTLDRGALKSMSLHFWAANLKTYPVVHSCIAFTACCKCILMAFRERPRKWIARSSTNSALKMSLAIQEGSSLTFSAKHVTAMTPPVGTPSSGWTSSEYGPNSDSDSAVLRYSDTKNRQPASEANHIARLFQRLFPNQRKCQLPVASVQKHPGDVVQD